mmetsp:Transcript_9418/g.20623  ORF Transcript_9418/g.20623 Transcript_9418/m.20623 type:complete len:150 (-) Transcript_9418:134-583(-)
MLKATMRFLRPGATLHQTGLSQLRRALCSTPEPDAKAELELFLQRASRPIMGLGKAKQSAGQTPLDLTKYLKKLEDLTLDDIMAIRSEELEERGVPARERKRLLNFANKLRLGWVHDGRTGKHAWKGWKPPGMLIFQDKAESKESKTSE